MGKGATDVPIRSKSPSSTNIARGAMPVLRVWVGWSYAILGKELCQGGW